MGSLRTATPPSVPFRHRSHDTQLPGCRYGRALPSPVPSGGATPTPVPKTVGTSTPEPRGEPHQSPVTEEEPHQSLVIDGDYLLLLPPSLWGDYPLLPPLPPGGDYPLLLPPLQDGDYLLLPLPPPEKLKLPPKDLLTITRGGQLAIAWGGLFSITRGCVVSSSKGKGTDSYREGVRGKEIIYTNSSFTTGERSGAATAGLSHAESSLTTASAIFRDACSSPSGGRLLLIPRDLLWPLVEYATPLSAFPLPALPLGNVHSHTCLCWRSQP
ncbi:UNVERIFIED_CONTAM: hypothetical protein FKN15_036727 [Acipenser sinensis]